MECVLFIEPSIDIGIGIGILQGGGLLNLSIGIAVEAGELLILILTHRLQIYRVYLRGALGLDQGLEIVSIIVTPSYGVAFVGRVVVIVWLAYSGPV